MSSNAILTVNLKNLQVKGTKTNDFNAFIQRSIHYMVSNTFLLLDNASIYDMTSETQQLLDEKRIKLIYNAPFGSKYNPIEVIFNTMKKRMKRFCLSNRAFDDLIQETTVEIESDIVVNTVKHVQKEWIAFCNAYKNIFNKQNLFIQSFSLFCTYLTFHLIFVFFFCFLYLFHLVYVWLLLI